MNFTTSCPLVNNLRLYFVDRRNVELSYSAIESVLTLALCELRIVHPKVTRSSDEEYASVAEFLGLSFEHLRIEHWDSSADVSTNVPASFHSLQAFATHCTKLQTLRLYIDI